FTFYRPHHALPPFPTRRSSDLGYKLPALRDPQHALVTQAQVQVTPEAAVFDANHHLLYHGRIDDLYQDFGRARPAATTHELDDADRKSTRLNSSHVAISYAVFC